MQVMQALQVPASQNLLSFELGHERALAFQACFCPLQLFARLTLVSCCDFDFDSRSQMESQSVEGKDLAEVKIALCCRCQSLSLPGFSSVIRSSIGAQASTPGMQPCALCGDVLSAVRACHRFPDSRLHSCKLKSNLNDPKTGCTANLTIGEDPSG